MKISSKQQKTVSRIRQNPRGDTWNAVVTTSLNIQRDQISSHSERRVVGEQVDCDLISDETIVLLYRLTTETT